ncbi:SRPBCC family protein [Azospirillum brasilense]|uniref:Carbon monoxide dehydrogenase n=1 Tax=Azospirillum brasilense TaxID=192 RepID=A0A235HHD6_AZOBR|nr:carbon monoxide dehydrogenase subunit G [Azospirillum brasilense]OYD85082.1 carbon monoxide dehydrogenase [Azospirillum brasilense]
MDMSGSQRITAPRDKVWAALNDPDILRQCIPGCEEVQKTSDTEFTAKVVAKVGPVSAKFSGKVTLSDLDPPNGYTITGEGSGGAAGFGKGGAKVSLEPDGETATVLSYTAHATVGGKLAQIGSRLVDATARKMADDFFNRFTAVVGGPQPEPVADPVASPVVETVAQPAAMSAAASQPVTPAVAPPAPEIPIPLPAARGRGGFYVPWAALAVVAVLVLLLAWMK